MLNTLKTLIEKASNENQDRITALTEEQQQTIEDHLYEIMQVVEKATDEDENDEDTINQNDFI